MPTVTTPWNSKDSFLGMITGNMITEGSRYLFWCFECTAGDIVTAWGSC